MTDPGLVLRKLAVLREYAERARQRRPDDVSALASDPMLEDALAMSLLVAIQQAVEICFHVVSDQGWGLPASYSEGFTMLAEHGVIDAQLAQSLARMAALRNRLVHGYASVQPERVWEELPPGFDALERYVAAIARHLETD